MEIKLGKIENVDVELIRGCFLGIDFTFSLEGGNCHIGSGGKYTVNTSENCKWDHPQDKRQAYYEAFQKIADILKEAKVNKVQNLKGIPVKVKIENDTFKDFEILKEVL